MMNISIKNLTMGAVFGLAVMVSGAFATPAHAVPVVIDFESVGTGTPLSYTEDNMTVISEYAGPGSPHIHLISGGNPGTALRNHGDGCCSSPYKVTFNVPVNIISLDWKLGGVGENTFLTNGVGPMLRNLPFVSIWTTFFPVTTDFQNVTEIIWAQSTGNTYIDNLVYEVVGGSPIPEPSTMLLLGTGLAGIVAWRARKQQA